MSTATIPKSTYWDERLLTTGPGAETSMELLPAPSIVTMVAVVACVFITIAILFLLAIFIDCRQRKITEQKLAFKKRMKQQKLSSKRTTATEREDASIAANMEEAEDTPSPLEMVYTNGMNV